MKNQGRLTIAYTELHTVDSWLSTFEVIHSVELLVSEKSINALTSHRLMRTRKARLVMSTSHMFFARHVFE